MIRTLLKSYMTEHRVTYRVLAARTGIHHATLCRYVNGGMMDSENYNRLLAWMLV